MPGEEQVTLAQRHGTRAALCARPLPSHPPGHGVNRPCRGLAGGVLHFVVGSQALCGALCDEAGLRRGVVAHESSGCSAGVNGGGGEAAAAGGGGWRRRRQVRRLACPPPALTSHAIEQPAVNPTDLVWAQSRRASDLQRMWGGWVSWTCNRVQNLGQIKVVLAGPCGHVCAQRCPQRLPVPGLRPPCRPC